MNGTRTAMVRGTVLLGCALLTGCGQLGSRLRAPAPAFARANAAQDPDDGGRRRGGDGHEGKPYGRTKARLQYFREDIELDRLDVEFDGSPDIDLRDVERDRFGFRADFGSRSAGGFFQLFGERLEAPGLFGQRFHDVGIGGGVVGAPVVDRTDRIDFVVPYRFEVDLVGGKEDDSGFDEDLLYLEGMFEIGLGARLFGLQLSSGGQLRSLTARFDSDNPASPASLDTAVITGTNVGAYFEVLYKHEMVPLMARVRALVGDVRGLEFSFGFAF